MIDVLVKIVTNYPLLCAASGWLIAQILKFIICIFKTKRLDFALLIASGGMPSSHSACVCALSAATARVCGFDSPLFAVSAIFAFVVMYDASGVRRASGEQAKVINRLVQSMSEEDHAVSLDKDLKELIGHTPLEVIAGACLGVFIVLVTWAFGV